MEILDWIGKDIKEIKNTLLFGKYFDSVLMNEGTDVYYLLNPMVGIDMILQMDYVVKSIHFYSSHHKGIKCFPDKLPFNLEFVFSKGIVRSLLGKPNEMSLGGPSFSSLFGPVSPWDKYLFKSYYLHIEYNEAGSLINLVTIGLPW